MQNTMFSGTLRVCTLTMSPLYNSRGDNTSCSANHSVPTEKSLIDRVQNVEKTFCSCNNIR
jgi:hypothetical protein